MSYLDSVNSYGGTSGISGPSNVWSPVASGANSDETQTAVDLSTDEGVITTLGGNPGPPLTYNAAGLLNAFVDAGTDQSPVQNLESYAPLTTGYGTGYSTAPLGNDCDDGSDDGDDDGSDDGSDDGMSAQLANTYGNAAWNGGSSQGSSFYATA